MVFPMKPDDKKCKAKEESDATIAKKKLLGGNMNLMSVLDPTGMGASVADKGTGTLTPVEIIKISGLVAGSKNKGIEARIENKSCVRTFDTRKLFSLDLTDASGSIRINIYDGKPGFDELHHDLEINGIVHLENFKCGLKNSSYNKTAHECELTWTAQMTYKHIVDDNKTWPSIKFKFVPLLIAKNLEPGSTADVIAMIGEIGEIEEVVNGPLRRVKLVDQALSRLEVTFWKAAATEIRLAEGDVLAIKQGVIRTNTFRGHTQTTMYLTLESLVWVFTSDLPLIPKLRKRDQSLPGKIL